MKAYRLLVCLAAMALCLGGERDATPPPARGTGLTQQPILRAGWSERRDLPPPAPTPPVSLSDVAILPRESDKPYRFILFGGCVGALAGFALLSGRSRIKLVAQQVAMAMVAAAAIVVMAFGVATLMQLMLMVGGYLLLRSVVVWTSATLDPSHVGLRAGLVVERVSPQLAFWLGIINDPVWLADKNEPVWRAAVSPPRPLAQASDEELMRLLDGEKEQAARDELVHRLKTRPRLPA